MTTLQKRITCASIALMALLAGPLQAEWQLITDFQTETREDFYVWKRFARGSVYFDGLDPFDSTNRAFYMDTEEPEGGAGNIMYMALPVPSGGVAPNGKASLKYDILTYGSAAQFLIGLSDVDITVDEALGTDIGRMLTPKDWSDYETVTRVQTSLDARNGNEYLRSEIFAPVLEWMTLYQYIDNEVDSYEIWYKFQGQTEPTILNIGGKTAFTFRNGGTNPLTTIMLAATRGTGDETPDAYAVDNVYMDMTGRNPELGEGEVKRTTAFGRPIVDGYVDTDRWFSWMYADTYPYFYQLSTSTWAFIDDATVDVETGGWAYLFYAGQDWNDWTVAPDGWVDTGAFLQYLNLDPSGWAYSATLNQWLYMGDRASSNGSAGIWTYLLSKAAPVIPADYIIPATVSAPIVDGILSAGEWNDANTYNLTYEALVTNGSGYSLIDGNAGSPQPGAVRAEAVAKVVATAQGLYVGFDVTDSALYIGQALNTAGNKSDGVQVGIDVNPNPLNRNSTILYDINPASLDNGSPTGPVSIYARWAAVGNDPVWGLQVASSMTETGYIVEAMIPWAHSNSFGITTDLKANSTFRLTFMVMDRDPAQPDVQGELLWDAGNGEALTVGDAATWPIAKFKTDL